jgi:hypothetical protein
LVAIAPFRLTGDPLRLFSRLEFLGTGYAGSDYLDVIVRRGFEVQAVQALADASESDSLALRLVHLRPGSLASRLAQRLDSRGWSHREADSGVCPLIHLAGHTWDSYLASRGAAHRANVRRRTRALGKAFTVRFEQAASSAQRVEALRSLVRFHDARWTGGRGSTAFRSPALRSFHDEATERGMQANFLRLYTLYLDETLAGVMYAFSFGGRFFFYQHGFDERYRPYSLGLVLMALTINAAIEEGATEFDLLYGTEDYKFLWADDRRELGRLDLYPARIGGKLQQRRADLESSLRAFARRLRPRHGHVA